MCVCGGGGGREGGGVYMQLMKCVLKESRMQDCIGVHRASVSLVTIYIFFPSIWCELPSHVTSTH